jgi:hypothetical protein
MSVSVWSEASLDRYNASAFFKSIEGRSSQFAIHGLTIEERGGGCLHTRSDVVVGGLSSYCRGVQTVYGLHTRSLVVLGASASYSPACEYQPMEKKYCGYWPMKWDITFLKHHHQAGAS